MTIPTETVNTACSLNAANHMKSEKYRVVKRLESGGMAEVFIGEAFRVQGFKKRVAIKRVLPHLAQNDAFIGMFLDEARLGARMNHGNIVSVIDIGAADNTYFIVMEYVDGANLKTVMESFRRRGQRFPLKEAIYMGMEACRALSYAHELIDEDGVPLGIVHRDVSPPNILISRRGETKMMDFGLAKATTQLEKTDPGVVKGKFSYLSPEAALGREVDARADLFALGIVLWEMLSGRRLFLGESDFETVKLVQAADVPSLSRINPAVDEEFEAIIGRALARDRDERFHSAREMGDALADYLFRHRLKVTSYDISALVKEVIESRRPTASSTRDHSIIDRLIQEELLRFTSLDEMQEPMDPGRVSLSPEDPTGALPLDAAAFENPAEWFADDPLRDDDDAPRISMERVKPQVRDGDEDPPDSVQPGYLADALEEHSVVTHVDPNAESLADQLLTSTDIPSDSTLTKAVFFFLLVFVVGLLFAWLGGSFG